MNGFKPSRCVASNLKSSIFSWNTTSWNFLYLILYPRDSPFQWDWGIWSHSMKIVVGEWENAAVISGAVKGAKKRSTDGSKTAATSKMKLFVIIVNGFRSPRSASEVSMMILALVEKGSNRQLTVQ